MVREDTNHTISYETSGRTSAGSIREMNNL